MIFELAATHIRTRLCINTNQILHLTNSHSTDGTAEVLIWLAAEVTATIMAACIPFYRPLVRKVAGKRSRGQKPDSYSLSNQRSGANRLGSRVDVKSGFREPSATADDSSDRAIIEYELSEGPTKPGARVEYNSVVDEEAGVNRPGRRRHHGF